MSSVKHSIPDIQERRYIRPYNFTTDVTIIPTAMARFPGVSAAAKLIWATLARFSGGKTFAFPSNETIANEIGMSQDTVQRGIAELAAAGFLLPQRRGRGKTNVYHFLEHHVFQSLTSAVPDDVPGDEKPQVAVSRSRNLRSTETASCGTRNRNLRDISVKSICRDDLDSSDHADSKDSAAGATGRTLSAREEWFIRKLEGITHGDLGRPSMEVIDSISLIKGQASFTDVVALFESMYSRGFHTRAEDKSKRIGSWAYYVESVRSKYGSVNKKENN